MNGKETLMALNTDQKKFITKKVISLGTMEGVKSLYCKDDRVSAYALQIANKLFKKGERNENL
jgi:hypothetical protein